MKQIKAGPIAHVSFLCVTNAKENQRCNQNKERLSLLNITKLFILFSRNVCLACILEYYKQNL